MVNGNPPRTGLGNLFKRGKKTGIALNHAAMLRAFFQKSPRQPPRTGADLNNMNTAQTSRCPRNAPRQIQIKKKILSQTPLCLQPIFLKYNT
jgi:hypothetical protein